MLRADRWGRLREGVRRCQLRRGAWYPVLRVGTDAAVVVVRHQSVIVPPSYLEIVDARPSKWTLIARERYAVGADGVALARNERPLARTGVDDLEIRRGHDHRLVAHDDDRRVRPDAQHRVPRPPAQLAPADAFPQPAPAIRPKHVETLQFALLASSPAANKLPVLRAAPFDLRARPPLVKPSSRSSGCRVRDTLLLVSSVL